MKKINKQFRKQLIWAGVFFILSVSLLSAIYILGTKPYVYINPGVTMSAPSPVGAPYRPGGFSYGATGSARHTASSPSSMLSQPFMSVNSSISGLYLTSNAQMHSVGGGGGGMAMSASGGSSSRGRTVSGGGAASVPMTGFIALASTRQMAPPAAEEAPQMAKLAPRHAPGPPNPPGGGGGEGLPDDHQLVEHPIGEPWILVLMAALYALAQFMFFKRRKAA